MPSTVGEAATAWNVAFGETMMPKKRARRLFGAGVEPATGAVVVISLVGNSRLYHGIYEPLGRKVSSHLAGTLTSCET
jgi:hypothetical protein